MTRSLIALLMLTMPLTGCSSGLTQLLDWGTARPAPVGICPDLDEPPAAVVSALRSAAAIHPEVGAWSVKLEKHYEQLDACKVAK